MDPWMRGAGAEGDAAGEDEGGEETGSPTLLFPLSSSTHCVWGIEMCLEIRTPGPPAPQLSQSLTSLAPHGSGSGNEEGGMRDVCGVAEGGEEFEATSGLVWPVTFRLADLYSRRRGLPSLLGARVVEIGAGTGLLGIAAAARGADVVLTDLPNVVANIQRNIDLNSHLWINQIKRPLVLTHVWGTN
mmetsp:Transcript_8630/g.13638  ORF Transcript_8630/g.13638 Transcript_8630/m.13638 type:complete len:187 (-) Transcript_8630:870-1430(-)